MTSPSVMYMTPIHLWSTLVSHSRQRYGTQPFTTMVTRIARMTTRTTAMLYSGRGWSNGIAAQVSFPSMSISRLTQQRTAGAGDACLSGTRHRLVDDVLEQLRRHRAIGSRRHGRARLCQFGEGGTVESRSGAAHLLDPCVEIAGRHRFDDKPHLGKAVAAEVGRKAGVLARLVGEEVEMGGHAAHRVDLAAELRHEERIHHRR